MKKDTNMEVENHLFVVDFMVFLTGPGHPRNHVSSRECNRVTKNYWARPSCSDICFGPCAALTYPVVGRDDVD